MAPDKEVVYGAPCIVVRITVRFTSNIMRVLSDHVDSGKLKQLIKSCAGRTWRVVLHVLCGHVSLIILSRVACTGIRCIGPES